MRRFLLRGGALLVAALVSLAAAPPAETIDVGGIRLSLGMPQQAVIERLSVLYRVETAPGALGGGSSWYVRSSTSRVPDIASLFFRDEKLWSVNKYWGPDDQQAGVEFASALYGALTQMIKEGKRTCSIATDTNKTPQSDSKSFAFLCGGKYIDVQISKNDYGEFATVSETLVRAP